MYAYPTRSAFEAESLVRCANQFFALLPKEMRSHRLKDYRNETRRQIHY